MALVVLALVAYAGEWYLNKRSARMADRAVAPTRMVDVQVPVPAQTPAVNVPMPSGKKPAISGNFVTSGKYGAVHSANGGVVVSESGDAVEIRLSEDFAVSDAPDMYVWLYPKQDSADFVATTRKLDLGPLTQNSGPATYRITKSEFDQYGGTVVIWCKEFSVEIARAVLKNNN